MLWNVFFLYHGEDPLIIHHCCPLWMSRPLYVAELTSSFFLRFDHSYNVPAISLMDLFSFWCLTIVCFTFMERSLEHMMWVRTSQQPLPNANATLIRWTKFHSGRLCLILVNGWSILRFYSPVCELEADYKFSTHIFARGTLQSFALHQAICAVFQFISMDAQRTCMTYPEL